MSTAFSPPTLPNTSSRLGHVGYWTAALALVLGGLFWQQASQRARESALAVDHTLEVLQVVGRVNESLARAESANRGRVLFANPRFEQDRDVAAGRAREHAGRLVSLTADNAEQHQRARRLLQLVEERTKHMPGTSVLDSNGPDLTARSYVLAAEIRGREIELLAERRREFSQRSSRLEMLIVASVLIAMAVLVPGYLGFIREARSRWRAQRQLAELAESLPGAVFQYRRLKDGSGRYEFATETTGALRGVARERALRDPNAILESIVEEDRPVLLEALARAEKDLKPVEVDYRVNLPGGVVRWLRTTAAPRLTSDGTILWSGHWGDVTDKVQMATALVEAKEKAEAATQAKSAFLATMSHEIRTPMNGILGMLELVLLSPLDPQQRTSLEVMSQSGRTLLRIIDDILDFSKIEAGKLKIVPEAADLRETMERVGNIYSGNASSKGIVLRLEFDEAIRSPLWFDPVRMQQVLGNLVSNAIKYSNDGEIVVSARLARRHGEVDELEIVVSDRGAGIPAEQQAALFQPFMQAHTATGQSGGTGLGLSICRRLVEKMAGEIELTSTVGVGTSVRLRIPFKVADGMSVPSNAAPPEASVPLAAMVPPSVEDAEADGRLLLLVDDHPINRMVMLRQVNVLGYAAECAENGREALACWQTGRFGLVLTDCHMPEMNGYDLARRIREMEQAGSMKRTPILACTANALGGEAERCLAAGMDDYLAKPASLSALRGKLDTWLPQVDATDDPFDPAGLAEVTGGDPEMAGHIVKRFHQLNEADAEAASVAFANRDAQALRRAAHRMTGAGRTVGAIDYAFACEQVEKSAGKAQWEDLVAHMPLWQRELARIRRYAARLP